MWVVSEPRGALEGSVRGPYPCYNRTLGLTRVGLALASWALTRLCPTCFVAGESVGRWWQVHVACIVQELLGAFWSCDLAPARKKLVRGRHSSHLIHSPSTARVRPCPSSLPNPNAFFSHTSQSLIAHPPPAPPSTVAPSQERTTTAIIAYNVRVTRTLTRNGITCCRIEERGLTFFRL